jgi:hypothetical protein
MKAKRNRPTITLKLRGTEPEGGLIRLDDFLRQLRALEEALTSLDRGEHGESTLYYRIVKSQNSPSRIVIEPVLKPSLKGKGLGGRFSHYPRQIQHHFFNTIRSINEDTAGELAGEPVVNAIADLLQGLGSEFETGELVNGKTRIKLDENFKEKVSNLIIPDHRSYGSVEGELLALNVSRGRRQFGIYPSVGPKSVLCTFPEHLFSEAYAYVRKRVRVYGTKLFRRDTGFPFKIEDVTGIELLKVPNEVPHFTPTPDVPAINPEQLIRESREEEEEE